jgi:hypothetical protein
MLKLPKSHERTFDQLEFTRAISKLKSSYHIIPKEKIEEINSISPDIRSNDGYYGMTFDEARYRESIRNLRNGYYTLTNETINRVKELAKSI